MIIVCLAGIFCFSFKKREDDPPVTSVPGYEINSRAHKAETSFHSATINCAKTVSEDEKAICNDITLQQLDAILNKAYDSEIKKSHRESLKADQKAWLEKRKGCNDNTACLKEVYISRIQELLKLNSIKVINKSFKLWDFFLILSSCDQDEIYQEEHYYCYDLASLNVFPKGKNESIQVFPIMEMDSYIRFEKKNLKENLIKAEDLIEDSNRSENYEPLLYMKDVNFDGFDDIILRTDAGGAKGAYPRYVYLYDATKKGFVKSAAFSDIISGSVYFSSNPKHKTIVARHSWGACDSDDRTYRVNKSKPILIEETTFDMEMQCCVMATRKLVNGKWKTIKKEKLDCGAIE